MKDKFIVFALALLLCINMASAVEFDNVKRFNGDDMSEVTIKNSFGFGADIATVKLDTPLYHYVPAGNDVQIAEMTISNMNEYASALQKVDSYDMRNGRQKQVARDFTFKVKSYELAEVPVYGNGKKQIGTEMREQVVWTPIEDGKVPAGEVIIGIFTDTAQGEIFDYVPTLFGVSVDEWAVVEVTETIQGGAWATNTLSNARGWNITVQGQINVTRFILEAGVSGATRCFVRDASNNNLFTTSTFVGQECIFADAGANLSTGNYRFMVSNVASNYDARRLTGESLPQDTGNIIWVEGANENLDDDGFSIQSVVYNITQVNIGNVTLTNPVNNSLFTTLTGVTFNATAGVGAGTAVNATMYLYDNAGTLLTTRFTDSVAQNKSNFTLTGFFGDGIYFWNIQMCGNLGECKFNSSNFTFTLDSTVPIIDIVYPEIIVPYHKSGNNLTINYTFVELNPSTCLFNYGISQPNTTFTNCGTNSSFNVTNFAIRNVTAYINDTSTNLGYNLSRWAYYVFENSRTFSLSTSELATETYTINATYNSSIFSGLGVYFNYNGTSYSTSSVGSAPESMTFSSTLTVPSVPSSQNIPFYWIFVLQNSTGTIQVLTDISTQTVNDLALDNCTTATQVILNYTLRDEDVQNILLPPTANSTIDINVRLSAIQNNSQFITYTASKNNTNPITICVTPSAFNGGSSYRLDSVVGYQATDREYEFHNIQNLTISNATIPQNISLFDLLTSRSTEFVIRYRDSALNPVPDVLIDISRQYIGEGVFKSVEVPKTDFEGKTVGHLVVNEVIYNIIVSKEGKVISTFTNIIASCQNPSITDCTIDLQQYSEGVNPVDLEQVQGAVFNISFNPTVRVVNSIFSTLNGASSNFTFLVSTFGNNTQICSQSLTTSSGMITCNIPQTTGNVTFVAKLYKDNVLLGQSIASLKIANRDLFGNTGAIMAFFLYLLLPFIALSSGAVPVLIFAVIGFFLIGAMFLINTPVIFGTGSALIWLGITVIIILIKYNMRER